ncbi:GSCFA family protein [Herbaspirillum sp. YR522]|nr:GSCFA family protein [Herbaspirillum sp. YR522]
MHKMNNPYTSLPGHKFWRNAVADLRSSGRLHHLWRPRFSLTRDDPVITVGSCFAQHISRYLIVNGFSWVDSEPAPASLGEDEREKLGYGVFSFRTGNIYTPALLEQWIDLALGGGKQAGEGADCFSADGKFFDPLRPAINAYGYGSLQEAIDARSVTLHNIEQAIIRANTFIFTLGLTEAWRHRDGTVFPVCPGTIRGCFDPDLHQFHNYDYDETVATMQRVIAKIRKVNPAMRFLLTVSPVPLTATADCAHILPATTYSKSVLRAAAGFLSSTELDVDYFPSYELVSSPLFAAKAFADNMRSVTDEGVSFVMAHFMAALGMGADAQAGASQACSAKPGAGAHCSDAVCEDLILESWSRKDDAPVQDAADLLLVGDSHMGKISTELNKLGTAHCGGAIMWGSRWHHQLYTTHDTRIFVPHEPGAEALWVESLRALGGSIPPAAKKRLKVITNIGAHTHMMPHEFLNALIGQGVLTAGNLNVSRKDVHQYLVHARTHLFEIVKRIVGLGHEVIWVSDPPSQQYHAALHAVFDEILCEFAESVGARAFNARVWIGANGGWTEDAYRSDEIDKSTGDFDRIHGNDRYYRTITGQLQTMLGESS